MMLDCYNPAFNNFIHGSSCQSYLTFCSSPPHYDTPFSISYLLGVPESVSLLTIPSDTQLIVPVTCSCHARRYYSTTPPTLSSSLQRLTSTSPTIPTRGSPLLPAHLDFNFVIRSSLSWSCNGFATNLLSRHSNLIILFGTLVLYLRMKKLLNMIKINSCLKFSLIHNCKSLLKPMGKKHVG
ncbi:uncharacterized protein LOC126660088 [Mercurialis annua]|uniref:uncharacterized protein LOC126660088 n=1 Tax=Mercurialis annua TaxID=3986 RepID=UPI0021603283|nr:uncharacterized protein LOC126660088 [Mercurialis annua]